jgi:hypothetical protein
MRALLFWLACVLAFIGGTGSVLADTKAPPEAEKPSKVKRVIHSIELAVSSKEPFDGAVTLKLVGAKESSMLTYYWGGKCKKTGMPPSRLQLLTQAMERGYAVEIPSQPLAYNDRIYMCIRSVRILSE